MPAMALGNKKVSEAQWNMGLGVDGTINLYCILVGHHCHRQHLPWEAFGQTANGHYTQCSNINICYDHEDDGIILRGGGH